MEPNEHPSGSGWLRLRREILIMLVVKTALLAALWWLFFAHAPSKGAVASAIGRHLAEGPAPTPSRNRLLTRSNNHDR